MITGENAQAEQAEKSGMLNIRILHKSEKGWTFKHETVMYLSEWIHPFGTFRREKYILTPPRKQKESDEISVRATKTKDHAVQ